MAGIGLPSLGMGYQEFVTGERRSLRTRFLVWGNKGRYVDRPGSGLQRPSEVCPGLPVSDRDGAAEHGVENLHDVFYRGAFHEDAQLEV